MSHHRSLFFHNKAKEMKITILPARKEQAPIIARMIMTAMDLDCCQNFAGPHHTLDDFHRMMTGLVERDDSQYSYRNTLVAQATVPEGLATEGNGEKTESLAGIIVGYDGRDLRRLRKAFIDAAKRELGQDFTGMLDETGPGEYYIDSLCVAPRYRHQGIASSLIKAFISRHGKEQPVGLLVDKGNPKAEHLYSSLGFEYVDDTTWGGHEMKHLQFNKK